MSQKNQFYYDGASNLTCVRDPDNGLTYYQYRPPRPGDLSQEPGREVAYYDYNTGGQVKTRKLGNHALVYYTYDSARRVTRIQHRTSALAQIATLNYQYDHVGNPVSIIREDSSATYFSYDSIYQLTAETQLDSGGDPTFEAEYQYDGAHNRTVKVIDGAPAYYTYNEANQLETEKTAAGTIYYHYDGCGNTTAKQAAGGTTYLQYNTENLLTRIDFAAGGGHAYYTYDGDSKRVSQRTADGYTGFVYQGPDMLALQLERNEAGTTQAHYTIGQRAGVGAAQHHQSLLPLQPPGHHAGADRLQPDGERHLHHDAWGVLLSSTGSTVNPHTYVGRERYYRMANADLYHLGFRDYNQALGRFMTVDPMGRLTRRVRVRCQRGGSPGRCVWAESQEPGPDNPKMWTPPSWEGAVPRGSFAPQPRIDINPKDFWQLPPSEPLLPACGGRKPEVFIPQPFQPNLGVAGNGSLDSRL